MRPKRLISLLVAVCMMITMLPLSAVTAFAEDTSAPTGTAIVDGCEYDYRINTADGTATITKFRAPDDHGSYDITIPTAFGRFPVTAIGKDAFRGCSALKKVTIPQSVTSIGENAFFMCTGLETLSLGENIKTIGDYAFYSCYALTSVTIPQNVTSIGEGAFASCKDLGSLTINGAIEKMGNSAFAGCKNLTTLSLGEKIKTIGNYAFEECSILNNVTIPDSVTSIGDHAFSDCLGLETLSLGENIETIDEYAFDDCSKLKSVTIPENVKEIKRLTFFGCSSLESITLPAGFMFFNDPLIQCRPECVIYFNNDEHTADERFGSHTELAGRKLLCLLCNVTFDANGGKLNDSDGNLTDHAVVPVYTTKKITKDEVDKLTPTRPGYNFTGWYTTADGKPEDGKFDVDKTEITKNTTLHARWEFDPNALVCHPLTVTGGTVTVKYDGSDVTSKLNSNTDATTGQKTYYVPQGAEVTVTLDKTLIPEGMVFDGWSTSLPTGQDYKAESITFSMSNDMNVSAKYRDAAADHTPDTDTAVCHPLTVTGGIVTVKKGDKDVTDTLTVTTDETTGKKTYYVPDNATVTVKLDKNTVHNGKVFDGWSTTGNLSLLTGQDSKAETITFTMNSDAKVSAKYRDAAADHTHDTAACRPLTVTGGIVTVKNGDKDVTDTLTVTTDATTGKKTYSVPDGATVTVTLDKTQIPEGMVFDIWSTGKFSLPLGQDYKAESITFTMNTMSSDADIAAQYRDASIEDDGPNVLGTAAIIGTAAVGTAVLGYQAYSLGAEFAGKLMALPYFPSNRSALAMMLWEDAGKPMPESELLYPDVGQEERDMDLQHAARWAMENELIPDLNDEGTAPEEMKFFPANPVSKLDVLNAWQKAQELKNN